MFAFEETLNLDSSERLISLFRGHAFRLAARLALPTLFLFVLFLFLFPLFKLGIGGAIFFLIALGIDVMVIARLVLAWYGTLYGLTNRRLLSIHRSGFFKKQTQEILLENISELSASTRGPLNVLFQFGDVRLTLYTASHSFTIHDVVRPQDVLNAISQQIAFAKKYIKNEGPADLVVSEDNIKKGKVHARKIQKQV